MEWGRIGRVEGDADQRRGGLYRVCLLSEEGRGVERKRCGEREREVWGERKRGVGREREVWGERFRVFSV